MVSAAASSAIIAAWASRPVRYGPGGGSLSKVAAGALGNFLPVLMSATRPPFTPNHAAMSCYRSPLVSIPLAIMASVSVNEIPLASALDILIPAM